MYSDNSYVLSCSRPLDALSAPVEFGKSSGSKILKETHGVSPLCVVLVSRRAKGEEEGWCLVPGGGSGRWGKRVIVRAACAVISVSAEL